MKPSEINNTKGKLPSSNTLRPAFPASDRLISDH
jgi:hypothetical protein